MKIVLFLSDKKREQEFHQALVKGFSQDGDEVVYYPRQEFDAANLPENTNVVVIVGVKSKRIYDACRARGVQILLIDKGYFRNREYYRLSLGGYQPPYLTRLSLQVTSDRLHSMGVRLRPRQTSGNTVLFAGSSHKYCAFHELGDVNAYARTICDKLNDVLGGRRQVVYRPKPSWAASDRSTEKRIALDRSDLPNDTLFSGPNELLTQLLPNCHCLATHGSTAALDALAAGVPVLLTSDKGVSPAWYMAESNINSIMTPNFPSDEHRQRIFAALAWCQFSIREMASGFAWEHIKPWYKENGYASDDLHPAESEAGSSS